MKRIFIAMIAAGFAAPAFAQVDFASLDTDQNGAISLPELRAVFPDLTEETFNAIDIDGSGDLSQEELAAVAGG